jgi:hypothetical protein
MGPAVFTAYMTDSPARHTAGWIEAPRCAAAILRAPSVVIGSFAMEAMQRWWNHAGNHPLSALRSRRNAGSEQLARLIRWAIFS